MLKRSQGVLTQESKETAPSLRPRKTSDIVEYEIDGEVTLFDPQRDQVHILNQVAAIIWRLCDGSRTVDELAEDVSILFDADLDLVQGDVGHLLEELEQAHLVLAAA
ncbi:MAG: PqqD family protein [Dehalococcoidia bacterium]